RPAALEVVVEVPECVEADTDVASGDAGDTGALRVAEAAAEAARRGEHGRPVDQVEGDAVRRRRAAAVLKLIEGGDQARTRRDRTVVQDGAGLVELCVGELEVAGRHTRGRHWTGPAVPAVGDVRRTGRQRSSNRASGEAGGALHAEVGVEDRRAG